MKALSTVRRSRKPAAFRRFAAALAAAVAVGGSLAGCAGPPEAVPHCGDSQRLAIIAQSVPTASYVPCVSQLPQGWSASAFDPARGRTRFRLDSDRAAGRPVTVELRSRCAIGTASPTTPRAEGAVTYIRLSSISPRYSGTLFDVFPGGCVTYSFTFDRGPHILLMEQFEGAISLYPRQQLRLDLRKKLGVELDP